MNQAIVVHPRFDATWPFAADHFHALWQRAGPVEFVRLERNDARPLGQILSDPGAIQRLVSLNVPVTAACLEALSQLEEAVFQPGLPSELAQVVEARGIEIYSQPSGGFWGQSVSEYALALTLCWLRRIPQLHHAILTDQSPWNYSSPNMLPGERGAQFGDDARFTCGTARGKRVRVVGVGNIGSRYASFMNFLGADVAAWDPYANEPCFHRAGARRVWRLKELVEDAEIFAPMLPLRDSTRGLVRAKHIDALPKGCLVVLVTRARICDTEAIRRRVLADELTLAADVFDIEPLPLDDPLLGRPNVVHSPHNGGRTIDANQQWAEYLTTQFRKRTI